MTIVSFLKLLKIKAEIGKRTCKSPSATDKLDFRSDVDFR